ncbi:MAG: PH domain-containing protein [Patescibacteria group bacterium]|nr:PH domain-containing protein [Patescibacteria group bacterium]
MSLEKALNLKDDEKVIYAAHQFPLTYWPSVVIAFALLVAPFFFMFPLFELGWWGVGIFVLAIVFGVFYALRQVVQWYYNVFVVTDQRVIDIDQRGFFDRTVSVAPYQNIQDVSYRIHGVCQTVLRYGNVLIQTASTTANLEVRKVRHPHVLQELINELKLEARTQAPGDEKINALKEFTDRLTIGEIKALVQKLKSEEKEKAVKDFFSDEENI